MISKYKYKGLTWVDIEKPTRDQIIHISSEYDIPVLVGDEMLKQTERSKVDKYDNLIYLILHFPIMNDDGDIKEQEIDFVIGQDYIITVHYESIPTLQSFTNVFEPDSILEKGIMGAHAGYLFLHMIKHFYNSSLLELEGINVFMKEIEKNIFNGQENNMVAEISKLNRKLLDFKQAIRFHGEILRSFESAGREFFGQSFSYYLSSISGEFEKVHTMLEGHKEILNDLRDTNDSLLTTKTNETIKVLTIMTFIMLPLTLITGVFGMNSQIIFINNIQDFAFIICAMMLTGIVMFIYFKKKKWL
jgi:magnesium transporter